MRGKLASALTILAGLVLGPAPSATASAFRVTPVRVDFGAGSPSTLLTLTNESSADLRFQISTAAWSQDEKGEMQLTPSDDVIFFPALVTLKPGEERKVRVGMVVAPASSEKTYRIFFEELPPMEKTVDANRGSSVRILTKMGIPIFVAPDRVVPVGDIKGISIQDRKLRFMLTNGGNVHYLVRSVRMIGFDGSGKQTFEKQREGWYVLSGAKRTYDVDLTPEECSGTKRIRVDAITDLPGKPEASILSREVEVPPNCGR